MAPQAATANGETGSGNVVTEYSPLQSEIKKLIKSSGPMPVWRYMELCLTHPKHGYYVSRDPLGREGDFTTAPEVSQMFGELLGLWAASVWKAIGSPSLLRLIELGPGRGRRSTSHAGGTGYAGSDAKLESAKVVESGHGAVSSGALDRRRSEQWHHARHSAGAPANR